MKDLVSLESESGTCFVCVCVCVCLCAFEDERLCFSLIGLQIYVESVDFLNDISSLKSFH